MTHTNNPTEQQATPNSEEEQLDKPNDIPDLSKTHSIVDIPKHGKVYVITDIYEYYKTIEAWHQQELERAVDEARLDELMSIELGCEDSEARTEWLLNSAISTNTSGRSLKDRIIELEEGLKK